MGKDLKGKELGVGICQIKNGKYVARFTKRNGKRIKREFFKLQECRKWMADAQFDDEHGNVLNGDDPTVEAWYRYWIDNVKGDNIRYNTRRNYNERYEKNIKQHIGHMLLKDIKNNFNLEDMLYIWDKNLAKSGAKIIYQREKYVEALLPFATEIFDGLSKGREKIDLRLDCGFECKNLTVAEIENEFTKQLISNRNNDLINKITTVGPHRDDMEILINGKSARLYGSQGQQRSCVLALKLAEASLLKKMTDDEPLALLDDVMSELDESRQDYILNHIKNWQVFITCCDANTVLRLKKGKTFHIENGRCIG